VKGAASTEPRWGCPRRVSRPRAARPDVDQSAFAGVRFPPEVITVAVAGRWLRLYRPPPTAIRVLRWWSMPKDRSVSAGGKGRRPGKPGKSCSRALEDIA
jgi:hypothetical protein